MSRASLPRLTLVAAILGLLAACGGGQGPAPDEARMYMKGLEGRSNNGLKPGVDPNALYAEAMGLQAKGDCAKAVPKLRQVAGLGPGYEGAEAALGGCLVQGNSTDLSADYLEGLTWLRRAADGGWPEAQGQLAYAHALGPKAIRNADEAAYWLALYNTNTGKARVGFVPLPDAELAQINAAIPAAAKAAGEKRAETWQRKVWIPPVTPDKDKQKDTPPKRHLGIPDDDSPVP